MTHADAYPPRRCPECGATFCKGRAARYCDPCRRRLKAERKRRRREIRRAELGLFPRQRSAWLSTTRKRMFHDGRRPLAKNLARYHLKACVDCARLFRAGARAVRCIPCYDRDRRKRQGARDRARR